MLRFVVPRDARGDGIHTVVLRAHRDGGWTPPAAPIDLCGARFVFAD